ncbi:hypothetical protein PAPYR_770 [Paratrimastix pyriformis]|uniref:Uncharacterized protein n=1 Tax=Paratrimastix pyriformis TaxID=342808 RepID=A0ABQ8UWD4_9EUKA|nr:hypothetical protein PAPYR_770 [Paratrimastix pyriformis]
MLKLLGVLCLFTLLFSQVQAEEPTAERTYNPTPLGLTIALAVGVPLGTICVVLLVFIVVCFLKGARGDPEEAKEKAAIAQELAAAEAAAKSEAASSV